MSFGLLALLGSGCPDPGGEFDDYVGRLPDAGGGMTADAPIIDMVPDVSGTMLIGLTNDLLAGPGPVRFLATQTVSMTGGSYKLTLSFQPLHKTTGEPVGTAATFPAVTVSSTTGEFDATLPGELTIPKEANTLLDAPIVANSVHVLGRIVTMDRHCGTLTGMVTAPVPTKLEDVHTTYGAIRVASGTSGSSLPPPEVKCP